MKKRVRVAWRQCNTRDTVADDHGQAQREVHRGTKISIINNLVRRPVSEIKLIRTDTTLDLSQKGREAEEKKRKGKEMEGGERQVYMGCSWSVHGCKFCKPHRLELLPAASCLPVGSISLSC